MTYTLFLDDDRDPIDEDSVVVRSYDQAVSYVEKFGTPDHIDFDHDLGEGQSGYDFAQWIIGRGLDGFGFPKTFYVHSQNPVGRSNISSLMNSYMRHYA